MGCSGNIRRVLVVLGEGEHVYHGNSALVLFLIFGLLLSASVSFEPLLITSPTAELECPKPKRPGCSIGVSTVWSGARVTLAPEGGLRRYSRAFALRRVGLDRFLGGGSDGAPCGIVSPPPFVYRQRRYVYESYNRNRGRKMMAFLIAFPLSLLADSFLRKGVGLHVSVHR